MPGDATVPTPFLFTWPTLRCLHLVRWSSWRGGSQLMESRYGPGWPLKHLWCLKWVLKVWWRWDHSGSWCCCQWPLSSSNHLMHHAAGSAPGAALCWGTALLTHELASWRVGVETHEGMAEKKWTLLIYIWQVKYIAVNNRIILYRLKCRRIDSCNLKIRKEQAKSDAEA